MWRVFNFQYTILKKINKLNCNLKEIAKYFILKKWDTKDLEQQFQHKKKKKKAVTWTRENARERNKKLHDF